MEQLLYKYLILHQHLSIPQLGSFRLEQTSARLDQDTQNLYPPQPVIHFSETDIPIPNKSFYTFLARESGSDELVTIKQFHDFCYELRQELLDTKAFVFKGWGKLSKNEDDTLSFVQTTDPDAMLPVLHLSEEQMTAISTTETEVASYETETEELDVKDNWWFYALLLLICGIGALVYYYV